MPDLDLQIAGLEGVLQSDIAGMQLAAAVPGDNYVERMVKYIPGEVIGFSMLINAILDQALKAGGKAAMAGLPVTGIAVGALAVGCILTPLFCWYVREDGDAWIVNARLDDRLSVLGLSDGRGRLRRLSMTATLAAILVLTFTVVSGADLAGGAPAEAARRAGRQPQGRAAAGRGARLG